MICEFHVYRIQMENHSSMNCCISISIKHCRHHSPKKPVRVPTTARVAILFIELLRNQYASNHG